MKNVYFKIFVLNLTLLSLIVYLLGVKDSAFRKIYISDNIIAYVINSLIYFILWVLPDWWIIIFCAALLFTFLYWVARKIVKVW
jgi:hypothetical protein